jgi:hypothetical protein
VLSTFDTVQTLYHFGESTQNTSIQALCSLMFAQINSTDKSYDSEMAKGFSEHLLEIQKGYQRTGAGTSPVQESRDVLRESKGGIPIKLILRNDQSNKTTSEAGLDTRPIKKGKTYIRSFPLPNRGSVACNVEGGGRV